MIDIRRESILTLSEAARHPSLPRRRHGQTPHPATLFRWAQRGIRGIRLETIRIGGSLCTSVEALQRFFEELTEGSPTISSPVQSDASKAAAKKLDDWKI
jgi:hypothetical protein